MTHPSHYARTTPDKIAVRIADSDAALSYAELDSATNRAARLFRKHGIGPGAHVAGLLANRIELLVAAWAAKRSGIYFTPISTHLPAEDIAYILANSGARLLLSEPDCAAGLALPHGIAAYTIHGSIPGFADWHEALAAEPATPIADEQAGAIMFYSSGTTGRPKGIKPALAQGEPITSVPPLLMRLCHDVCGMDADTVYLSPAPLYHAAPMLFCLMTGVLGGTVVLERRFDPADFLRHVAQYQATHTQLVPTMFVRLLRLPPEIRAAAVLASLRTAIHAAAPCPIEVKRAMIDWWGPRLVEYYGASEAYGFTIIDSVDWLAHPGSVGRAGYGIIRITGDDGALLPPGEIGTVHVENGPKFSYHDEPEKTARAWNAQGWATVGDVGWLDAEGYLYLTDRRDYMIISGGANVYPQRCEDLLIAHPAVLDAAVFGVPDADMGEVVKAVVQLAAPTTVAELMAYCRAHLPGIACPRSIDFVEALPRTPTGKMNKRLLREGQG